MNIKAHRRRFGAGTARQFDEAEHISHNGQGYPVVHGVCCSDPKVKHIDPSKTETSTCVGVARNLANRSGMIS